MTINRVEKVEANREFLSQYGIEFEDWDNAKAFHFDNGLWVAELEDDTFHAFAGGADEIFKDLGKAFKWTKKNV